MSNVIASEALAKIAISKNLIKEYKSSESERTVYLNSGTEFQIYLKNPYRNHLGIRIYVNNKSIGSMLVLRPGQSFWLDRFVDQNNKFLFTTYQVEGTPEMQYAISNNGKVKIEFYHEREYPASSSVLSVASTSIPSKYYDGYTTAITGSINYYNDISTLSASSCCDSSATYTGASSTETPLDYTTPRKRSISRRMSKEVSEVDSSATSKTDVSLSLETGRVEKGGRSNQSFSLCDIDFDYMPFQTENILILPNSRKQVCTEDMRRKYCSQCGKKVSPKDKFCSNCGAKLV